MFLWGGGKIKIVTADAVRYINEHKKYCRLIFLGGGLVLFLGGMTFEMVCICVLPNDGGKKSVFLILVYILIFCHQIIL